MTPFLVNLYLPFSTNGYSLGFSGFLSHLYQFFTRRTAMVFTYSSRWYPVKEIEVGG